MSAIAEPTSRLLRETHQRCAVALRPAGPTCSNGCITNCRKYSLYGSRRKARAVRAAAGEHTGSNLGQLQQLVGTDTPESAAAAAAYQAMMQQQPQPQFSGVINVDGGAIFASLLLLVLLLGISMDRILGLDRLVVKWLAAWKEQRQYDRRNEVIAAREALEQQFTDTNDDEGGSSGKGGSGGRQG